MEVPKYLQILWSYKWLLLFGLLVSIVAGLLAGFTIRDGELEPRVQRVYKAATITMLSSTSPTYFQVAIPPEEVDEEVQTTEPVAVSLSDAALIYAYLVSSVQIREAVEARIGPLADDEAITGQARTTQPGEDSSTTNVRLSLPLIEVIGLANSPARAEEISGAANEVFQEFVVNQQTQIGVPDDLRVVLTTLSAPTSDEGQGSNPAIPVAVAALGSMSAFVALAYLLFAGQKTTEIRRDRKRSRRAHEQDADTGQGDPLEATLRSSRRTRTSADDGAADLEESIFAAGESAAESRRGSETDGADAADGVEHTRVG